MIQSRREWIVWGGVTAIIVATRLITAVHYIADPDSLRFALGLVDYDLTALQPHFPGYPVYVGFAKAVAATGLSIGLTFSLLGSVATLLLIAAFVALVRTRITSPEGLFAAFLITFTPMIWLMGNRYMPDLLGAGVALAAVVLLVRDDYRSRSGLLFGIFLVGLLAGIRLSYVPLVLLPFLVGFIRIDRKVAAIGMFALGVLIWFIPLLIDTGPAELIAAGEAQTEGHFTDFGGTIETAPGLDDRRLAVIEAIVADGFGGYWNGRHPVTLLALVGLIILSARGVWSIFFREPEGLLIVVLSISVYIGWILLYQNVIYQPRHVLPLLPILLAPVWAGGVALLRGGIPGRVVVICTMGALSFIAIVQAVQQREPTAIAQVADHLRSQTNESTVLRSTPLVCWFLASTGVAGECDTSLFATGASGPPGEPLERPEYVVGWLLGPDEAEDYVGRSFYHNPYVNAIWPELPVYRRVETEGEPDVPEN